MIMDIEQVMQYLPHRYPFLLIDKVIELELGKSITAIKNVTINEPFFNGHFPGNPVMPGVLQIEAMAQAAGVLLLRRGSSEGKVALLMSADKVKFRKAVRPGDQIVITAKLLRTRANRIATAEVTSSVDGLVVSSAELMFTLVDEGALE